MYVTPHPPFPTTHHTNPPLPHNPHHHTTTTNHTTTPIHKQQSLAKFLACLHPSARGRYLPTIRDVVATGAREGPGGGGGGQWRPREALAGAYRSLGVRVGVGGYMWLVGWLVGGVGTYILKKTVCTPFHDKQRP